MEKKEKKLMLVLPFTVLVAICGIMTYFACSADDDWEGSPEYLKTHAPMMTRAGVDVGDGGLIHKLKISQCPSDSVQSGMENEVNGINNFTAYACFYWNTTGYANDIIASQAEHINKPADTDTVHYEIVQSYFQNSPRFNYSSVGSPTVSLQTTLIIRYKKNYYQNGIFHHYESGTGQVLLDADVSDYAQWVTIINGTEYPYNGN